MTSALKYRVLDRQNTEPPRAIRGQLEQLGLVACEGDERLRECDILVVHRASDGPGLANSLLSVDDIRQFVEHGKIYVEYTSDRTAIWAMQGRNRFYGSDLELSERLGLVQGGVTRAKLVQALGSSNAPGFGRPQSPILGGPIPVLALCCQAYLAVHEHRGTDSGSESVAGALKRMGWRSETGSLLRKEDVRTAVRDPAWWAKSFPEGAMLGEVARCVGGIRILELARTIWPHRKPTEGAERTVPYDVVAAAYLEMEPLLRRAYGK